MQSPSDTFIIFDIYNFLRYKMVLYNVNFPDRDADTPIEAAGTTVLKKVATYSKWTNADMMKYLLKFYMDPGTSIKAFYKANLVETSIPEKTFGTYFSLSGLRTMQQSNTDFVMAQVAIEH